MANEGALMTADALVAAARHARDAMLPVEIDGPVLDTAGTGGDGAKTFNISTAVAMVAVAAGVRVAKQHNRAVSSQCGSTDLLAELGIVWDLSPEAAAACLRETGICFLHAPAYHPTIADTQLHVLAPLANPAQAQHQLIGVADGDLAPKVAAALRELGTTHSLVIHGDDGMDEITCTRATTVYEVKNGEVSTWSLDPRAYGYLAAPRHAILGGDAVENALIARVLLSGRPSTCLEVVQMNTAAALYAADRVASIEEGLVLAKETLKGGAAIRKLDQLVEVSRSLKSAGVAP
jgi:anthranilate phosphoribosyltransferase